MLDDDVEDVGVVLDVGRDWDLFVLAGWDWLVDDIDGKPGGNGYPGNLKNYKNYHFLK